MVFCTLFYSVPWGRVCVCLVDAVYDVAPSAGSEPESHGPTNDHRRWACLFGACMGPHDPVSQKPAVGLVRMVPTGNVLARLGNGRRVEITSNNCVQYQMYHTAWAVCTARLGRIQRYECARGAMGDT